MNGQGLFLRFEMYYHSTQAVKDYPDFVSLKNKPPLLAFLDQN